MALNLCELYGPEIDRALDRCGASLKGYVCHLTEGLELVAERPVACRRLDRRRWGSSPSAVAWRRFETAWC